MRLETGSSPGTHTLRPTRRHEAGTGVPERLSGEGLSSLHPTETDEEVANCVEVTPQISKQPGKVGALSWFTA